MFELFLTTTQPPNALCSFSKGNKCLAAAYVT